MNDCSALDTDFEPAGDAVPEGLVYVSPDASGITRRRRGKGFSCHTARDQLVSASEKARIAALAIPPAWTDVWICPDPKGHLQATGLDARGRKQYLYHPRWQIIRATRKFERLAAFGAALGRLRRCVSRDLEADAGDLRFSLAALVLLIDQTAVRVGSPLATRENRTFGATTLLSRHLRLTEGSIRLTFRAKGGQRVTQTLRHARLHRILQTVDDLPGRNLFTYIDEGKTARPVTSGQVNAYIAEAADLAGASAKTFRTWAGSVAAFEVARREPGALSVRAMAEAAAARLFNTPAISRSSYIHPRILDLAAMDADERCGLLDGITPQGDAKLRVAERHLLGFLSLSDKDMAPTVR